ncbi:MAG TPA: metalloregulator ArsR/SmtB family transcription factor [Gaiellaceae bacterium]|nr:metalloregulator ArsR/SmtB family transcription factor [Gaiellaceae bacterium]
MTQFVHEAMPAAQAQHVRFAAGPAFETLIRLSVLTGADGERRQVPPELREEIALIGDRSSELWLHLLGLALERPDDIAAAVRATPPAELRRHLAGVYVPSWRELVGADALEATARGDATLLDHDRYYAGCARGALEQLLPLTPAETKRRVLAVLDRVRIDEDVVASLEHDAAVRTAKAASPSERIASACPGYRYEPEPELPDVVLVPHVAARPWLLLCQHDRSRIICYPLPTEENVEDRLVALGRALGDARRVRMLVRLADGEATLAELADVTGLAKSTAHHHLAHLRAAGLVEMRGNAQQYRFAIRADGLAESSELLRSV